MLGSTVLLIGPEGDVEPLGVEMGELHVHAIRGRGRTLVLREAGHSYWTGIGMARGYAPVSFHVVTVVKVEAYSNGRLRVTTEPVIDFEPRTAPNVVSVLTALASRIGEEVTA